MGSSGINVEARFSPKHEKFWKKIPKINVFLRFFTIISILADFERNNSTDLFVEFFCEFFDTPGVPGGV